MFSLHITGFKNKKQVKAFIEWYEGQGEQDASIWFEEMMLQDKLDVEFMPVDIKKTYPIKFNGNEATMVLKIEV